MATIAVVTDDVEKGVVQSTWTGLASGSLTGAAENYSRYREVTIHVKGTFAGATLSIQGGHDGSNYQTLNDSRGEGNALDFTSADVRRCNEVPRFIRPEITAAASGLTSINVVITARSPR